MEQKSKLLTSSEACAMSAAGCEMCPTSLHQICVTCSPQSLFLPICKSCRFSEGLLTRPQHERSRKQTKDVKKKTELEQCYVPVILSDPAQHIQTLTKQRDFMDLCSKDAIVQKIYEVIKIICNNLHFQSAISFYLPYFFSVDLATWYYLNNMLQYGFCLCNVCHILYIVASTNTFIK